MKRLLACAAAAFAVGAPLAQAQEAAQPQRAQAAAPNPMIIALQGLQVAVLANPDGGIASVQSEEGDPAIVVFLTPGAAQAQLAPLEDQSMKIRIVDLGRLLRDWKGAIIFQGSQAEIANARELTPEVGDFMAPVFFVTSGSLEVQLQTAEGPVTPVMTSYSDAQALSEKLAESDETASDPVNIIPIEFATFLQAIEDHGQDVGYRFFTHPETVIAINQSQRAAAAQQ